MNITDLLKPKVDGVGSFIKPKKGAIMPLPEMPANYSVVVDWPTTATITWANGADATSVRHELSTDGGVTWDRLDDDQVPTTTSDHSLPQGATVHLRAKSVNASGESGYTSPVVVVTGSYDP